MTITSPVFRFALCGLVAALGLNAGCQTAAAREGGWKTYAIGRFLIDLPPQAEIKVPWEYRLGGDRITRLDETPETLAARIERREQELKASSGPKAKNLFIRRFNHVGGSTTLLYWTPKSADAERVNVEAYLVARGEWRAYEYANSIAVEHDSGGGISKKCEAAALEFADKLAKSLRSLKPESFPVEAGFVIDGAYIAGNEDRKESVSGSVEFSNHPGARFSFFIGAPNAEEDLPEQTSQWSVPYTLETARGSMIGGAKSLSRGSHAIGSIRGEENLITARSGEKSVYSFAWKTTPELNAPDAPRIVLSLESEAISFSSDREAAKLWEAVLASIRLRSKTTL